MAPHNEPGDQPWYRTPAATFTAGGFGAALIAALVYTVVQMSDEWSTPQNTVLTTPVTTQSAPTETRDKQTFVITPSDTSTTFTTSVPLSTTEIGNPTDATTSGTDTTTTDSSSETTPGAGQPPPSGTDMPTTFPSQRRPGETSGDTPGETRTTRNRPRYNETRTYSPG